MRADRLVATLLLLQARGRLSAAQVAAELEVSERTARRDLEALAMAGVPVYSQPGRHGGWQLVGGARTDLTGLTAGETRALFLLAGPSARSGELRSALRKLMRALPSTFRAEAEAAAAAVLVDPTGWDGHESAAPEVLARLQEAVVSRQQVLLSYQGRHGAVSERVVDPYGLVSKKGVWYLVAGTSSGRRTFRADRARSVVLTGEPVDRPAGFDLAASWREAMGELDGVRLPFLARAAMAPGFAPDARRILGTPVVLTGVRADAWDEVELRSYNPRVLAAQLAGFGGLVKVLGPDELLVELRRITTELTGLYLGQPARPEGAAG